MNELRPSPGPYKDISPAGWPGLLAVLVVCFGVLNLFVSREVAKILVWILVAVGLFSLVGYLRAFFHSHTSFGDLRSTLRALKDVGAAEWLGVLAILFVWVFLLTMMVDQETALVVSWVFGAAGALALGWYVLSVLRSRR